MIICICGPSGIGKTKLSIELAKKYDGIVLNADATQIYQELNIGSAKITEDEKQGIEHFLLDIKNPNENYSVSDYQKDGRKILEQYKNRNIIVIGGTGLYIKALFNDYTFDNMINNTYDDKTTDELYKLCLEKDSNVSIDKNNRVRLINFLNRENTTFNGNNSLYDVTYIGLTMPREEIYNRVNKRVDLMVEKGLIEEVKTLLLKYPDSSILKRAIGYKEIINYLNNEKTLEESIEEVKKNTRHYVKRQYTWFNNQIPVTWFDVSNFDKAYQEIISFIESLNSK